MEGLRCEKCGRLYMPPKYLCAECGNEKLTIINLTGKGEIFSYTIIRVPPLGLEDQAPYLLLLVRLEEGIKITGRLTGKNDRDIEIGNKVCFEKKEKGVYFFSICD